VAWDPGRAIASVQQNLASSLWALGIETRDSAQYRYVHGQLQRTKKRNRFVASIRITTTK